MAREVIFDVQGQKMRAGQTVGPFVVPVQKLAGATTAYLTLTVDDPTADPPTDAKIGGVIDVSGDNGATWFTVATIWAGASGTLDATVPIAGRRVRARGWADQASTVDLRVEVE